MLFINLKIRIIRSMIMCITSSGVFLHIHHDTLYTKRQGLEY